MKPNFKISLLIAASFCLQQAIAQKLNKKLAAQLAVIYKDDQHYRVAAIAATSFNFLVYLTPTFGCDDKKV